ncbi:23S rRNA (uracil(1939)-C(5))-methyltransferase RlmD [BD1-7 clade bacterium]|uniref:23S rRNA (Uracil(1939)-C(5))-methyltransferase RlmD n=1 Tax=BD1-7 clade bacterium TaxID=2029982 RepID=A0A5S9MRR4_9GAMM|nr:23S rRNA (uracil(1939)-C(5))-methyltransferase RlmD [BD1-7 clade bacterium]
MARKRYQRSGKPPREQHIAEQSFVIDEMDNLGQGVARVDGKITFIGKTLPGETVNARVVQRKKGVSFARLSSVDIAADNRVEPACPHFSECPACDYLHTDYTSELAYKHKALANYLRGLVDSDVIDVIAAPQRLGYRNRVQLHYRHTHIGMVDGRRDQVLPIPECQILHPKLQAAFDDLYTHTDWAKERAVAGHCELYLQGDEVSIEWDKDYAHGGFTQVNSAMNTVLCDTVTDYLNSLPVSSVLDLFAGRGNLSEAAVAQRELVRQMVDYTPHDSDDFIALDLYDEDALRVFGRKACQKQFDVMLVDPPRKGFGDINAWIQRTKPKHLVYVSCNAATLARDLRSIDRPYTIEKVAMLDLFPSTAHFESLVCLSF